MRDKIAEEKPHLVAGSNHWLAEMLTMEITMRAGKKILSVYELPAIVAAKTLVQVTTNLIMSIYNGLLSPYFGGASNTTNAQANPLNFTIIYEHSIGTTSCFF